MANMNFGVNILPKANNTYSLGNSDHKWNLYVNEINGTALSSLIPDVSGFYTKPSGGIPSTDLADTYLTSHQNISHLAPKLDPEFENSISLSRTMNSTIGDNSIALGWGTEASGIASTAVGYSTKATANYAYAEGYSTQANGMASHVEGNTNIANGVGSHAEGMANKAIGRQQHVEGKYAVYDTAFDAWTTETSYAVGDRVTNSSSLYECIEAHTSDDFSTDSDKWEYVSYYDNTTSNFAHIIGNGNSSLRSNALAVDWAGNTFIHGDMYVNCNNYSDNGSKVATESYVTTAFAPKASPVFTGNITLGRAANTTAGNYSIVVGDNLTAIFDYTAVFGYNNTATAPYACVSGYTNTASGLGAHAEGGNTIASATYAHAEGGYTRALGPYAHAEGIDTQASGTAAHAEGRGTALNTGLNYTTYSNFDKTISDSHGRQDNTTFVSSNGAGAFGEGVHTEGYYTYASGSAGLHAEGYYTVATGSNGQHAEGYETIAGGTAGQHAEGYRTSANGTQGNHAEGYYTMTSSGYGNHAEGYYSYAEGDGTHAEGRATIALGKYSHAEGYDTITTSWGQHAEGRYNIADSYTDWPEWEANTSYTIGDKVKKTSSSTVVGYICKTANEDSTFTSSNWTADGYMNFLHIAGNGTADNARSNAYALEWSGTGRYKGDLYVNCNADSTGGNKVATEAYVTTAIANASLSGGGSSTTLATVATTGDYDDLINKPDLSSYLTSVPTMVGATSDAAGTAGLVPAPAADAYFYLKFLCSNGTWSTVNATSWSGMSASPSDSLTSLTSAQVLARQSSVYTTIKFLSANATPTAYNLAMYDANAYLNSTTTLSTDNSTKVATTAFVKSVLPSTMTGATSSVAGTSGLVPAPTTGDVDKFLAGDGTYKSGGLPMVILSYGNSTWTDFINAYNNNVIVYCRASSNANPASGSQTRMAFMAYVSNADSPTNVEFQYYRSVSSHSATQMGDQVYIYKLDKTSGWSVTTREASIKEIKIDSSSAGSVSWSSNKVTLNSGLPKVTASDNGKILKVVNGAWAVADP